MIATNEAFIRTFEEIVTEVNRRAGAVTSRAFEIERAAERDPTVRQNRDLLIYIRDVRNTLQHPRHGLLDPAVAVNDGFLLKVQGLLERLRNPVRASSIGVARSEITLAKPDDTLGSLADVMKRNGFSHLPILDDGGTVIGIFNEAAVFDFLWSDQETIIAKEMQLRDILRHCMLDEERTETFGFAKPGTQRDELVGMFRALRSPRTRLGAVFVTASGKRTEPLQRMITAWDVLAVEQD
jgi:CBS domain-containing protein